MNRLAEVIGELILLFSWIAGIVLAHGFWSTFFSIFMPLYAWYLVIEKILYFIGFIN